MLGMHEKYVLFKDLITLFYRMDQQGWASHASTTFDSLLNAESTFIIYKDFAHTPGTFSCAQLLAPLFHVIKT